MLIFKKPSIMQLIYMSKSSENMSEDNLLSLVKAAQKYNIEHDISGFLISDKETIVQLLEGIEKEVVSLFQKIKNDTRHHEIKIQYQAASDVRAMPFLGMGLCFINSKVNLNHDFYYTRIQAREFSGLIDGEVGNSFRKFLF